MGLGLGRGGLQFLRKAQSGKTPEVMVGHRCEICPTLIVHADLPAFEMPESAREAWITRHRCDVGAGNIALRPVPLVEDGFELTQTRSHLIPCARDHLIHVPLPHPQRPSYGLERHLTQTLDLTEEPADQRPQQSRCCGEFETS